MTNNLRKKAAKNWWTTIIDFQKFRGLEKFLSKIYPVFQKAMKVFFIYSGDYIRQIWDAEFSEKFTDIRKCFHLAQKNVRILFWVNKSGNKMVTRRDSRSKFKETKICSSSDAASD